MKIRIERVAKAQRGRGAARCAVGVAQSPICLRASTSHPRPSPAPCPSRRCPAPDHSAPGLCAALGHAARSCGAVQTNWRSVQSRCAGLGEPPRDDRGVRAAILYRARAFSLAHRILPPVCAALRSLSLPPLLSSSCRPKASVAPQTTMSPTVPNHSSKPSNAASSSGAAKRMPLGRLEATSIISTMNNLES